MDFAMFKSWAETVANINACREFFTCTISGIRTALGKSNAAQLPVNDKIENPDKTIGQLIKDALSKLKTTMPKMFDVIDRVEWQSHKKELTDFLPYIKDAVYDAEDLLDEFAYYELKSKVESSKRLEHDHLCDTGFLEFFDSAVEKLEEIHTRLDNLEHVHRQFVDMCLHEAPKKFDRSVRPETTSFSHELEIIGRDKELNQLVEKLGVRGARRRRRTENEEIMTELNVLPIVGMGGIGKTTMAQEICKDANVKKHFDCIIWTCVSDDFDIKRLTKEIIEQLLPKKSPSDNLDGLMRELEGCVKSKRFLLVLDDMWDDVLKQDGADWKMFCGRLENGAEGSRILVTTRSPEVANLVGTMNHYELKGLQDDIFRDFFKKCAFGSTSSCSNQESLECIGETILPKLKGSPLAAKTIGRLLRTDLSTSHWESIVQSELWQIEQTETDILPALRLSYTYLSQKLKRCFSICAMYPKDHKFEKDFLADMWVAQGYVADPEEASMCFDALANRSFFQKASPYSLKYVIHDLMHDTAQLVSKDECFTIKHVSDIDKVPSNVRHLSIFAKGNIECSELKRICDKKKLRSLVCDESYGKNRDFYSLIDCWFKGLLKIRVLRFKVGTVKQLPESMENSKHLRHLCLLGSSNSLTLPLSVGHLHHLKVLEGASCLFESFRPGFSDAISLQKIKSKTFEYKKEAFVYKEHRAEKLCIEWSSVDSIPSQEIDKQMEVIPHWNLQHLKLVNFGGESCPSWFRPNLLPRLCSLELRRNKSKSVPFFGPLEVSLVNAAGSDNLNRSEELVRGFSSLARIIIASGELTSIPLPVWSSNLPSLEELAIAFCYSLTSIGVCGASSSSSSRGSGVKGFSSLAKISILDCRNLLSLDEFLTPDYLPVVKTLSVDGCGELTSLSVDSLHGLQDLIILYCSKLNSQREMTFPSSLKKLVLLHCGGIKSININININNKSHQLRSSPRLEYLHFERKKRLEYLSISDCRGLELIGDATDTDRIKNVSISGCPQLEEIQQPLTRGVIHKKDWIVEIRI